MRIVKSEEGDTTNEFGEQDLTNVQIPSFTITMPPLPIKQGEVEPIYEKIAPNEVLIISLQGDTILYVTNVAGTAHLRQVTLEE